METKTKESIYTSLYKKASNDERIHDLRYPDDGDRTNYEFNFFIGRVDITFILFHEKDMFKLSGKINFPGKDDDTLLEMSDELNQSCKIARSVGYDEMLRLDSTLALKGIADDAARVKIEEKFDEYIDYISNELAIYAEENGASVPEGTEEHTAEEPSEEPKTTPVKENKSHSAKTHESKSVKKRESVSDDGGIEFEINIEKKESNVLEEYMAGIKHQEKKGVYTIKVQDIILTCKTFGKDKVSVRSVNCRDTSDKEKAFLKSGIEQKYGIDINLASKGYIISKSATATTEKDIDVLIKEVIDITKAINHDIEVQSTTDSDNTVSAEKKDNSLEQAETSLDQTAELYKEMETAFSVRQKQLDYKADTLRKKEAVVKQRLKEIAIQKDEMDKNWEKRLEDLKIRQKEVTLGEQRLELRIKQFESEKATLEELKQDADDRLAFIESLEGEKFSIQEDSGEKDAEIAILKDTLKNTEEMVASLKEELSVSQSEVIGLEKNLKETKEKLEDALAAAKNTSESELNTEIARLTKVNSDLHAQNTALKEQSSNTETAAAYENKIMELEATIKELRNNSTETDNEISLIEVFAKAGIPLVLVNGEGAPVFTGQKDGCNISIMEDKHMIYITADSKKTAKFHKRADELNNEDVTAMYSIAGKTIACKKFYTNNVIESVNEVILNLSEFI